MADKLKMQSSDIIGENISFIESRFPNAIVEAKNDEGKLVKKVDFEILKQELSHVLLSDKQERYQMTWPDKKKSILLANSSINGTLRPCIEKSVDFNNTQNIYIEGDNLDVLKLLRETYLNKIKMIYIDPPYNTGNDFIYEDDFSENVNEFLNRSGQFDEQGNRMVTNTDSNGRFHTDWLNMMYPRLKIAKDLLSEDGVIFISIDDHELENLKKICNEIFGDSNFVGQWNWFKSATPPNLSYKIKKNIEYILVYEKQRDFIRYEGLKKVSPSNDPFTKPQNSYKDLTFPPYSINTSLPDGKYEKGIYGTSKFPNELLNELIIENGTNVNAVTFRNRFIWVQETLNKNISEGLRVELSKQLVLSYKKANYNPEVPPNLIDSNVNVSTTEQAGKDLDLLFEISNVFDYPKPVSLLQYLLKFKDDENAIILDFFSGSATTAHAVMSLNAEDCGKRKWIMVQLPELTEKLSEAYNVGYKTICEIGEERIRRAGNKLLTENGMLASSLDVGFRVLKLDSSNMKNVYYNPKEAVHSLLAEDIDNVKEDRTGLDLLFQVMLELGVELSAKIEEEQVGDSTIYVVNESYLVACFDKDINDEVVRTMANIKPVYIVLRDASFSNDSANINCEQTIKTISPSTELKVI